MDGGEDFNIVFPSNMAFPLPASFPAGIKGTELRVQNYNTIPTQGPAGTPAATEIDILVPEQPACFLDTDTTALYVECTYTGQMTIPPLAGAAFSASLMYLQASDANGGFIGGGASMFQRYQLFLNNAMISDDISEFGMVCYLMYLLNYTEEQRYLQSKILGFNQSYPSGVWGAAFHGNDFSTRATITATGLITTASAAGVNGANSIVGITGGGNNNLPAVPSSLNYLAGGVFYAANEATAPAPIVLTFTQNYNFCLHIPGILGSGNNRMLPMFGGPYRIALFMDNLSNYYKTDFGQTLGLDLNANPYTAFNWTTQYMSVNSVWFKGTYYKCDVPTFNTIMGSLPRPNTFIFRTTAFTVSSTSISSAGATGYAGQQDILIPFRRASMHTVMCCSSPSSAYNNWAYAQNAQSYGIATGLVSNPWGKYGWVNPNLGNGTCILLNGIQYPQQGNDPTNRPSEMWYNLLQSMKTWNDVGTKPCIAQCNFFVTDSIQGVNTAYSNNGTLAQVYPNFAGYAPATNAPNVGKSLWRPKWTTTTRISIPGSNTNVAVNFNNPYTGIAQATQAYITGINGSANGGAGWIVFPDNAAANHNIALAGPMAMTDKCTVSSFAALGGAAYGAVPMAGAVHFLEGTSCVAGTWNYVGRTTNQIPVETARPLCNQFIYACDLDQVVKKDILSGMSSLTGSFFWRVNVINALTDAYNIYFIGVYDQIVILDVALRTAAVRF